MKKTEITPKQKEQFNNMLFALKQIGREYKTPQRLRKDSRGKYGFDFEEAIEMAYENIQETAKKFSKGIKPL